MLQYLINASAIWLISLVIFDLFLRKETYHSYNRFYLIATLLLGIFLPLWQWQDDSYIYTQGISRPLQKAIDVKAQLADGGLLKHSAFHWETYLGYAYLTGVLITTILLIAEIIKLVALYNKGNKKKDGAWTIIETGKNHSPFSIFNYAFVSSKAQYTNEQWNILLTHEQLHSMAFHFADLLAVNLVKIIFWFHPLVYLYQKRILLVHEYQADKVSVVQPKQYGAFLVEQALLHRAPAISHSFNYSPIKSRIVMLTKKSSALAKGKLLLVAPLTLLCLLLFTNNSFSAKFEKDGNIVKYRGNTIELSPEMKDTMNIMDAATGKIQMRVTTRQGLPLKLNSKQIYTQDDLPTTQKIGTAASDKSSLTASGLKEYLLANLSNEIAKLDDGAYVLNVSNIVIDEKGEVVYYEYYGLRGSVPFAQAPPGISNKRPNVDKALSEAVGKKLGRLLEDAPLHDPAYYNGVAVPFLINSVVFWNSFTVKNHKLASI